MLEQSEVERWERMTDAMIRHACTESPEGKWGSPDPEAFAQVVQVLEYAMSRLPYACATLRRDGQYSWADIGQALGTTRQSAHKRFGLVKDGASPND